MLAYCHVVAGSQTWVLWAASAPNWWTNLSSSGVYLFLEVGSLYWLEVLALGLTEENIRLWVIFFLLGVMTNTVFCAALCMEKSLWETGWGTDKPWFRKAKCLPYSNQCGLPNSDYQKKRYSLVWQSQSLLLTLGKMIFFILFLKFPSPGHVIAICFS